MAMALLVGTGCDNGPTGTGTPPEPGIAGLLLDVEGNPAVDAPVGVIFDVNLGVDFWPPIEFGSTQERGGERHAINFGFALFEASTVTFTLQDFQRRPVRTFYDAQVLPAGEHIITWDRRNDDGELVPNSLYGTVLEIAETGSVQERGGILLNDQVLDFENTVGAIVRTDAAGRFRIPFSELPLGETCYCPDYEDDPPDGLCTIPLKVWIQSTQGIGRVRQAVHPGGLNEDLDVTLRMENLPD